MKIYIIISLVILTNLSYSETLDFPSSLTKAAEDYLTNSSSYNIYRVDLILFENLILEEVDKEESWPELSDWINSNNLVYLSDTSSLLVNEDSMQQGLEEEDMVISKIEFNSSLEMKNSDLNSDLNNHNIKEIFLPVEFFEPIENKELIKIVKKLSKYNKYNLVYQNSWYQPLFSADLSFPLLISSASNNSQIYGELTLYKQRFIHGKVIFRLARQLQDTLGKTKNQVSYNFNHILKELRSKINKSRRNYFWRDNFFAKLNFSLSEISSLLSDLYQTKDSQAKKTTNKINVNETSFKNNSSLSIYSDLFEINEDRKISEGEWHYIDHPYFGVLLKISKWNNKNSTVEREN